jgi:hypothetical protein
MRKANAHNRGNRAGSRLGKSEPVVDMVVSWVSGISEARSAARRERKSAGQSEFCDFNGK